MNAPTRFSLAALLALALALPAAATTTTQARALTGFTAIALSAPIRVDLTIGATESVVLEGDEEALARIETVVENGTLKIRRKPQSPQWSVGWNRSVVRARVTAKRIDALGIAGSGDIHAASISGDTLAVSIAGSGDVAVAGGKVGTLSVNIAGSGDVKVAKLEARSVSVSISGSGDVLVWARESLSVKVAGSGDVRYYGDPAVGKKVAGSGNVKRLGAAPT